MHDVIVVGGGIAGLSAALLLGRCLRRVLVCDHGRPRNAVSRGVHGFLSRDGVSPWELRRLGREQLSAYTTVEYREVEVIDARRSGVGFEVTLATGESVKTRKLLLATGLRDRLPSIPGIEECYGVSVHHCPLCDAWEHRNERLVVHGSGKIAYSMALELLGWSKRVTVCTNGSGQLESNQVERLARNCIAVRNQGICGFESQERKLRALKFVDGTSIPCDAMFFVPAQEQASPLAERLGCPIVEPVKEVIIGQQSEVAAMPGLFVVGNASEGTQLAIAAAAEAASAAHEINATLAMEDAE